MGCPGDEQLKHLARGMIEPRKADVLHHHIERCNTCRKKLGEYSSAANDLLDRLEQLPDTETSERNNSATRTVLAGTPSDEEVPALPDIPDYEPIKFIARGGFGQVWLAKQKLTGALYAVNVALLLGQPLLLTSGSTGTVTLRL